jgi:hypothetical protein
MKRILGAAVGSCVHIAGILNFLKIAGQLGFETRFAGSAISIEKLKEEIHKFNPDIVGISYRLSPESAINVFKELKEKIPCRSDKNNKKLTLMLGTTKPVRDILKKSNLLEIFDAVFTGGESKDEVKNYIKGKKPETSPENIPPQNLSDRIKYKKPLPVLRHHFGRPDLKETIAGIKIISESQLIDVISIGPDQNAQEFFFHPEKMDKKQDGAGGVPIRNEEDLRQIYLASRTGNYPLLRCYSGTNDIIKFADVLLRTINNAWCAVPLCWYNELDSRSSRKLEASIAENQSVMKWHAERDIPVEVNEAHHWSLRYSPDSVAVAAAYLAAYNAKKMGVRTYIAQYMFNTPPEISFTMDLAKMLAKIELIESLHDDNFLTIRQTRTGLYSMSGSFNKNKGQLASSTLLQMQLNPGIVHVVAFCESEHAAKPEDIMESTEIVVKVIENHLNGCPDMTPGSDVKLRKKQLINDANLIIEEIRKLDFSSKYKDPLAEPEIIGKAIRSGILNAPHIKYSKI